MLNGWLNNLALLSFQFFFLSSFFPAYNKRHRRENLCQCCISATICWRHGCRASSAPPPWPRPSPSSAACWVSAGQASRLSDFYAHEHRYVSQSRRWFSWDPGGQWGSSLRKCDAAVSWQRAHCVAPSVHWVPPTRTLHVPQRAQCATCLTTQTGLLLTCWTSS